MTTEPTTREPDWMCDCCQKYLGYLIKGDLRLCAYCYNHPEPK